MPFPLTVHGLKALQKELEHLKSVERPRVIADIAEARAHGDLKENAEYHAAREQQGFIEGRVRDLEGKLSDCQVIDVTTMNNTGRVIFGSTVTILNEANDVQVTYQIVGEDEADISSGKLSIGAPIARALIGKEADDVVCVQTPDGEIVYTITEVKYC